MKSETQVSDVGRLTQDLKEARALVSELVKVAEPFSNNYDVVVDPCFEDEANARVDCTVGDLRSLSEAVARAKKDTP